MKFSYNWLKELVPAAPSPARVAEIFLLHAFEVEGIEKKKNDTVLSTDVLPNRIADASGHLGAARELSALLKKPLKLPSYPIKETNEPTSKFVKVEVKDKTACPRYVARYIKNVEVGSSPAFVKERLEACGVNSINNVVDITNYVMLYTGQPLHAFDADKVEGKIIVRFAKPGEKFVSLDGNEYALTKDDLLIADEKGPLALAGIKGGKRAEVNTKTKNIILESANFNPENVERTAKRINLLTDAAIRFRVGIDPNLTIEAIDITASLLTEHAKGEAAKGRVDTGKNAPSRIVKLWLDKARSVLGFEISEKEIMDILTRLGGKVTKMGKEFKVTMPSVRVDIVVEEDIIEELARVYGLYRLTPKAPLVAFSEAGETEKDNFRERISERLAGSGYSEMMSYAFAGPKELETMEDTSRILTLLNPLRPEALHLRPALSFSLLSALSLNLKNFEEVRVFELGQIFFKSLGKIQDTNELQEERLALAFASKKKDTKPFFELKGVVSSLLESFRVHDFFFDDSPNDSPEFRKYYHKLYHPFRLAQIKQNGNLLGVVGELHPDVKEKFNIKGSAGIVEFSFDKLFTAASAERGYEDISKYPAVFRDLAIFVPVATRAEEVLDVIENSGGELLADTDLFDIYQGTELPTGQKSFAFSLIFESRERTLSEKEVDTAMQKIITALEANPEWEVRK